MGLASHVAAPKYLVGVYIFVYACGFCLRLCVCTCGVVEGQGAVDPILEGDAEHAREAHRREVDALVLDDSRLRQAWESWGHGEKEGVSGGRRDVEGKEDITRSM